jgi:hypothetical protein
MADKILRIHTTLLMGTGAGGNCPPHFEKLAKLINPFLALTL